MANAQDQVEIYTQAIKLLEDIYSRQLSTLTILRKARLIAKMAGKEKVVAWIDKEISGYNVEDTFPDYRFVEASLTYKYILPIAPWYFSKNKSKLISQQFVNYRIHIGVSKLESCVAEGLATFKGNILDEVEGVEIYEYYSINKKNLIELLDNIQEEITKELESIIADSVKKQPLNMLPQNQIDIKDILSRFNDYRKYDKESIKDEDGIRADMYKILKPFYPDLVDEEYLSRFGVKNPKVDFAIPSIKLLIENKFVPTKKELPRIQEEILADIPSYLKNNKDKFDGIIVFIYSRDHIPTDFTENLKQQEGILDVIIAYATTI